LQVSNPPNFYSSLYFSFEAKVVTPFLEVEDPEINECFSFNWAVEILISTHYDHCPLSTSYQLPSLSKIPNPKSNIQYGIKLDYTPSTPSCDRLALLE